MIHGGQRRKDVIAMVGQLQGSQLKICSTLQTDHTVASRHIEKNTAWGLDDTHPIRDTHTPHPHTFHL